ncbi:hypothetical protein BCR33DRAFT_724857 [Rhizoclosmatium globosum]|uniref:Transmembrane protein n=1 Tax=Rhizoclosmatium globosum TaxID=329046 RepID=A0A1Y2B2P7_9FUNG|nr:hypothetical protein BCR33DRAFT_724857 [Rhizoclosmatium globosum]|eukprot:ORY29092.1 hypothetical protein BCR33DRAFT_724857 [Rhizoclosmatium globosum]
MATTLILPTPSNLASDGPISLLQSDSGIVTLVANLEGFLAGLCICLSFGFICYMAYSSRSLQAVFTKKNSILLCYLLSISATFMALSVRTVSQTKAASIALSVFAALNNISYLWYSFERSADILRIQSPHWVYRTFIWVWRITVAVLLSPILIIAIPSRNEDTVFWGRVVAVTACAGALLFDAYLVHSCCQYLMNRTLEIIEVKGPDAKSTEFYPIVARHTIVGAFGSVGGLACYVGGMIVSNRLSGTSDLYLFYLLQVLTDLCGILVASTLVIMKIRLVAIRNKK